MLDLAITYIYDIARSFEYSQVHDINEVNDVPISAPLAKDEGVQHFHELCQQPLDFRAVIMEAPIRLDG